MRAALLGVLHGGVLVSLLTLGSAVPPAAAEATSVHQADAWFLQALAAGDKSAVEAALDAAFAWTDSDGRTRNRAGTLNSLPALAAAAAQESEANAYDYGEVGIVSGVHSGSRFSRIWVKRPQGWRAFVFLDTPIPKGDAPPATAVSGITGDCDNPCRTIPFRPRTATDRAIVSAWQKLKNDEWHPNPDQWAAYVADEFVISNTRALTKAQRVAQLAKQKADGTPGAPGDPVMAMRIYDFARAAVMISQHAPYRGGRPYYNVRIWVYRDGRWQIATSQQTTIQNAEPVAGVAGR